MKLFVTDWMTHPLASKLDAEAKKTLKTQLDYMLQVTKQSDKELLSLARSVYASGVELDFVLPGARKVVQDWINESNLPRPQAEKIPGGVRMPAETFLFAGFGPAKYRAKVKGTMTAVAVGIYVPGNIKHLSERTEAQFVLDEVPGDGEAVLDILGMDNDHDVPAAEIRIEVNGRKIFEGPVRIAKWTWSRQEFAVPAGVLRKGKNKLEVINVCDPKSIANWYERWFMLSEAVVRFKKK